MAARDCSRDRGVTAALVMLMMLSVLSGTRGASTFVTLTGLAIAFAWPVAGLIALLFTWPVEALVAWRAPVHGRDWG
jgi:hypothetical protein